MPKNTVRDYKDIESWFRDVPGVLWGLYEGSKITASNRVMHQPDEELDKDESWAYLEDHLKRLSKHDGARLLLHVKTGPKDSAGHHLKLDLPSHTERNVMSGIHGYGPVDTNNPGSIHGLIEKRAQEMAKNEIEKYKKDREIEDLWHAVEEAKKGDTIGEKITNRIIEHPRLVEMLEVLLVRLLPSPQGAQVGVNGFPDDPPAASVGEELPDDFGQEDDFYFDVDRAEDSLLRIQQHFPDIYKTLDRLADFIEEKPALAKEFINGLNDE